MYQQGLTEFSLKALRFPTSKLSGRLEDMIIVFVGATHKDINRTARNMR